VELCRAGQATYDNIIQSMRIGCWITEATNVHSENVIFFFAATVVTRTRINVTFIRKYSALQVVHFHEVFKIRCVI